MLTALTTLCAAALALAPPAAVATMPDLMPTIQKLFEAGRYQEAADRVARLRESGAAMPDAEYLAGLSYVKLMRLELAQEAFQRLTRSSDDDPWVAIGESASALFDMDLERALVRADRAVALDGGLLFAHYQQGLVLERRDNNDGAVQAFERAVQIDPEFAYAHYHAGMAYYRMRRVDRMVSHFEAFTRLAPDAPERGAVQSILKTLRGRR
jgi:tetratricopeptide (TPR) repeat protein